LCLNYCFYSLYTHPSSTPIISSTSVPATFSTCYILPFCLFYVFANSCIFLLKTVSVNCSQVNVYLNYLIFYILHYFCDSARLEQACCLSLFPSYSYKLTASSSLFQPPGSGAAASLPSSPPLPISPLLYAPTYTPPSFLCYVYSLNLLLTQLHS
jgi:hypothetical protein